MPLTEAGNTADEIPTYRRVNFKYRKSRLQHGSPTMSVVFLFTIDIDMIRNVLYVRGVEARLMLDEEKKNVPPAKLSALQSGLK